jgi:hypothetical protein
MVIFHRIRIFDREVSECLRLAERKIVSDVARAAWRVIRDLHRRLRSRRRHLERNALPAFAQFGKLRLFEAGTLPEGRGERLVKEAGVQRGRREPCARARLSNIEKHARQRASVKVARELPKLEPSTRETQVEHPSEIKADGMIDPELRRRKQCQFKFSVWTTP